MTDRHSYTKVAIVPTKDFIYRCVTKLDNIPDKYIYACTLYEKDLLISYQNLFKHYLELMEVIMGRNHGT